MNSILSENYYLKSLDISSFDKSKVNDIFKMFDSCANIETLDFSHFRASSVLDMGSMLRNSYNLKYLDLSAFNTSNIIDMFSMLEGCDELNYLDISIFKTSNFKNMALKGACVVGVIAWRMQTPRQPSGVRLGADHHEPDLQKKQ